MPAKVDFSQLTLMDTLDMATLIEVEAFERYSLVRRTARAPPFDRRRGGLRVDGREREEARRRARERRHALFGAEPAKVTLDDIFDVEAPDVGSTRWNMSEFNAYQVALHAEKKAYAFYDRALRTVKDPDVKALFEELREEEAEHVRMVEEIIAKLPPSAKEDVEDEDDTESRMGF